MIRALSIVAVVALVAVFGLLYVTGPKYVTNSNSYSCDPTIYRCGGKDTYSLNETHRTGVFERVWISIVGEKK